MGKTLKIDRKAASIVMAGKQRGTSFRPAKIRIYEREKLYRDQGMVWVAPTRGKVWTAVVASWQALQWPTNHFRTPTFFSENVEVGAAYDGLIGATIDRKHLRQIFDPQYADMIHEAPFVLTTEEDNVLPQDAVLRMMEAIHTCPDCGAEVGGERWRCPKGHHGFDAVSGLYFMKSEPRIPMAFGEPRKGRGVDHVVFWPQPVGEAIKKRKVIEVYGIAMGCALWRKGLFRKVSRPWFTGAPHGWTQDLWFCKKARSQAKARFGVHCGIQVGHLNPRTGEVC